MLILHLGIVGLFILIEALYHPYRDFLIGSTDLFFMINYVVIVESYLVLKSIFIYLYTSMVCASFIVTVVIVLSHFWYSIKDSKCVLFLKRKFIGRYNDYELIHNLNAHEENDEDDNEFINAFNIIKF